MNGVLRGVIGFIVAILWLVLLVATHFSGALVATGLLAALCVSGSSSQHGPSSIH